MTVMHAIVVVSILGILVNGIGMFVAQTAVIVGKVVYVSGLSWVYWVLSLFWVVSVGWLNQKASLKLYRVALCSGCLDSFKFTS
jgi:hypothetical protein